MLARLIELCATRRWFVLSGVALLTVWGAWALRATPLDALPDLSDTQVIVTASFLLQLAIHHEPHLARLFSTSPSRCPSAQRRLRWVASRWPYSSSER